jgi:hypothetical protein
MTFQTPIPDLIRRRYSCRSYERGSLTTEKIRALSGCIEGLQAGPFGSSSRFYLAAADGKDRSALHGLGTYGFIRGEPGFLMAATREQAPMALEDFGWQMEHLVLQATDLNLGTCWLGGSFTRSTFARKVGQRDGEILPAVCALGQPAESGAFDRTLRRSIGAQTRLDPSSLFFDERFGCPLDLAQAGAYALVLEMVRLGPSASNKQPWRIVRSGSRWHLFLQRTPGYREGILTRMLGVADMQRVDMGIAMCHFELAAKSAGLEGKWSLLQQEGDLPDARTEYIATWTDAGRSSDLANPPL